MSWLVRRRKSIEEEAPPAAPAGPDWAGRLRRVGFGLDATGLDFKAVAVVAEGGPETEWAFVTALAWRKTMYHQRWTNVTLRVNDGVVADVMDDAAPAAAEALQLDPENAGAPATWSRRYEAVGALLDELHVPIVSPSLVDLGDSVLVNALRWRGDETGGWKLAGLGYTNAEIEESARAIEQARAAAAARERKR